MMLAGVRVAADGGVSAGETFQVREEDHDESHQRMAAAVLLGRGAG